MALEDKFREHDGIVVDKFAAVNAAYEMTTRDYVLRAWADPVSGPYEIVLPPVSQAKGRFYSIVCRNADGANTITITHDDDSECWLGDIVLDGKCDAALFYSDGYKWWPLFGGPGAWPGFETTAGPGTTGVPTTAAPTSEGTTGVPTTTLTTVQA